MTVKPNLETAVQIAFASSQPDPTLQENASITPHAARWSELSVYYDPTPKVPGKRWIAISRGLSTYRGETTKEEAIQVGTLERALKLFRSDSQLGRIVITQAEDWAETEWSTHAPATLSFGSDDAALRWLYGDEVDQVTPAGLLKRDFGAGESTVRAAIADGRPIKVPFLAIARFVDREAFRRWRESRHG